MPGVAALGRCFATSQQAAEFICGSNYPISGLSPSGEAVSLSCWGVAQVNGSQVGLGMVRVIGGEQSLSTSYMNLTECVETDWQAYYPASMSIADAATVSSAVIGIWGLAWAWKALRKSLGSDGRDE